MDEPLNHEPSAVMHETLAGDRGLYWIQRLPSPKEPCMPKVGRLILSTAFLYLDRHIASVTPGDAHPARLYITEP